MALSSTWSPASWRRSKKLGVSRYGLIRLPCRPINPTLSRKTANHDAARDGRNFTFEGVFFHPKPRQTVHNTDINHGAMRAWNLASIVWPWRYALR